MAELRIGLLGKRGDPQISRLQTALSDRGASAVPFDLSDIPAHVNFSWDGGNLQFGDLLLDQLDALYVRAGHHPMPLFVPGMDKQQAEEITFPIRETGSLLNTIVVTLAERVPTINSPHANSFHRLKPHMYKTLQNAGVPLPPFWVGCDLAGAAHFVDRYEQQVVIKPLMGGEVFLADFEFLKNNHSEVERRPFLLQRRILGRSLRAYTVSGKVVAAAEIVHGDVVDWRSDTQDIVAVDLPRAAQTAAIKAAAAMGLVFAAVDIEEEQAADNRPWVIDVNPAPMFAGFEQRSGLDVAGSLADALVTAAQSGHVPSNLEEKS